MNLHNDTICAIATAQGHGAIAVLRLSGPDAIQITERIFIPKRKSKQLSAQPANTIHYGTIMNTSSEIDDVLVSLFKAPHSYTGEDIVEISCHGSQYVQQTILQLLITNGARLANPGEFTQRAFLTGKMDLSQAEAVADLIASGSKASHTVAVHQMRGGFSREISNLRARLLHFISLIELELDFSEEDVEFADRIHLQLLVNEILTHINGLTNSFKLGNVIKHGVPVAIIGQPNVGKSTLLNVLLKEEKAIVSEIAGTTRDAIEDVVNLEGIQFRFIDTAGLRQTTDTIENLGIELTYKKVEQAEIIVYLIDGSKFSKDETELKNLIKKYPDKKWIIVINKIDKSEKKYELPELSETIQYELVEISAKNHQNIDKLIDSLLNAVNYSTIKFNDVIVTNARHYEALQYTQSALDRVKYGIDIRIPGDLLAQDIREALHYLGEITGEFTTDEILGNIFKNFCIGK